MKSSVLRLPIGILVPAVLFTSLASAQSPEAQITIDADRVTHSYPLSRHLTGACIEDVNHEIYGGIDSQMVFGESFQEPLNSQLQGFQVLGGYWTVHNDELLASGFAGDKLVSELPAFTNGEVGVEVFVPDRQTTNAGLIVRVGQAAKGMDQFDGYEISLNAKAQHVQLGRHRHNWEHIRNAPCAVPVGQWVPLVVKLNHRMLEIFVNGQSVLQFEDGEQAILAGTVGLRQFQREARYRRLWVTTDGETRMLPFAPPSEPPLEVSGMWRAVRTGAAKGTFSLDQDRPFIGRQSQRVSFVEGQGSIGVENQGLNGWGMYFVENQPYEGVLWAKSAAPADLFVALESRDGSRSLAETQVAIKAGDWQRLSFSLQPNATEKLGRLAITLRQPGSVVLGYACLQPGAWGRFHGLPVRRDVAEGLIAQGITVLRYGGSMVNNPEYRWKKMIGPRDRRPPYNGTWYPYSSNGWGILDFLDLCQAAGFLSVPAFNMDETPQDMGDFIEYANGANTSDWGRRRVSDGHTAPYNLRYIQLGNEERVDDLYFEKFKAIAEAIWSRDPQITIVVGDFAFGKIIRDPFKFTGAASRITTLAPHQKILRLAKQQNREVWFDLHIGTDGPRPDSSLAGTFSFIDALEKIADGARFKVVVFELNARNHSQRRALANALAISAIERDGRIPVVTSANGLQPDGQNDNDWNQGLLFLNPSQVWLQPPGYVTQMFSQNYLPRVVNAELSGAADRLDVVAKRSDDGKTLLLQVVNPGETFVSTRVHLTGFVPTKSIAQGAELSGPLGAANTAAQPNAIVPQRREWNHAFQNGDARYTFPPFSITMLRLE